MPRRFVVLVLLLASFFLLAPLIGAAWAHSWYEPACCSGRDCQPLPDNAVTITKEGYHVKYDGLFGFKVDVIIPFDKARPSRDEKFHGCNSSVRFLCLYAPASV